MASQHDSELKISPFSPNSVHPVCYYNAGVSASQSLSHKHMQFFNITCTGAQGAAVTGGGQSVTEWPDTAVAFRNIVTYMTLAHAKMLQ